MKITVKRVKKEVNITLSEMCIDGELVCFCLEDAIRDVKIKLLSQLVTIVFGCELLVRFMHVIKSAFLFSIKVSWRCYIFRTFPMCTSILVIIFLRMYQLSDKILLSVILMLAIIGKVFFISFFS